VNGPSKLVRNRLRTRRDDPQRDRDSAAGTGAEDPLEQALSDALDVWAEWLRSGRWVDGYPDRSVMFGEARSGTDWQDLEEAVDLRVAQAVDAAIEGLTGNERAAVFTVKVHSLYQLREPIEVVYLRARAALRVVLVRRGVLVV